MTPPDTKQLIEVTQADRDAAADHMQSRSTAAMVRRGDADPHPHVQAFARHRLSALQQPDERDDGLRVNVLTDKQQAVRELADSAIAAFDTALGETK